MTVGFFFLLMSDQIKILISFHIAPELVKKIKAVDPRIQIIYDPSLLGKPRYLNDQHGAPIQRTPEQEHRFKQMMRDAEILFGYVPREYSDIKRYFPSLKWN